MFTSKPWLFCLSGRKLLFSAQGTGGIKVAALAHSSLGQPTEGCSEAQPTEVLLDLLSWAHNSSRVPAF